MLREGVLRHDGATAVQSGEPLAERPNPRYVEAL